MKITNINFENGIERLGRGKELKTIDVTGWKKINLGGKELGEENNVISPDFKEIEIEPLSNA